MFGRKHQGRRSTNIVFVIFRLMLSLIMFGLLLGGVYSAYKHFSGLDPLNLDPQAIINNLVQAKIPFKLTQVLPSQVNQVNQKILGRSQDKQEGKVVFKFLLLADSHNDNLNLRKAITQAKQNYPDLKFIIGLGDYTDVGTIQELDNAKKELDNSTLRYFLLPGDHDLWDSRDKQLDPGSNFRTVFGPAYQSFTFDNFKFILLFNSDNYVGMREDQINWLTGELEKAKQDNSSGVFVFVHEPLYHPSSDHAMGRVEKNLKTQAKNISFQLKTAGVKKVFAGDTHYFSEYDEPQTGLSMMTTGAVAIERNPQAPRFAVVYVFEDGSAKVEDIEIK